MNRVRELDMLRGFAVCGITLVNAWQHAVEELPHRTPSTADWLVENLAQSRFFPIFSFLFGIGFVLFLRSAADRTARPRAVMLRRLAVLAALGALHTLVNSGEVLLPYAAWGAAALLPATFLPRAAVLAAGAAATLAAALLHGGGSWLIPGLLLLGMAAARYAPGPAAWWPVFAASAALGALLTGGWLYLWAHPDVYYGIPFAIAVYPLAGLAAATAYCTGLLLAHRRWLGRLAFLEPLGRIALTAYLAGTAVSLATRPLLPYDTGRAGVLALAVLTAAALAWFADRWLARFTYGPVEWVWRCLTWGERVPLRRPPAPAGRTLER
ncbi:hypothetical protein Sru01_37310 [Sphaerisporangium rufum]|uniref:DUF418 domain-containing protein n=1 Tax=Sphaerisporangium rufum TaxID=1381558 RepID=A0A919V0G7_9ACTN|nr:DUF418 domain-containing protein [Sphaerisporangium rufum]GII78749.1 hypothetical protein Sru01_37310 [Sphaerisporangium rufum]